MIGVIVMVVEVHYHPQFTAEESEAQKVREDI